MIRRSIPFRRFLPAVLAAALFLFAPCGFAASDLRSLGVSKRLESLSGTKVGAYRALAIGIDDYRDKQIPDLQTAVADASAVAALLQSRYGFVDVSLLLNEQADGSGIQRALRSLVSRSGADDAVLIYYAGHGDLDRLTGDGWWIPQNAVARDPATYIDNATVQKYVRAIQSRHVLLVADSCFSGTLFGQARAMPKVIDDRYYGSLYRARSRWGMTSGNLTPVTDAGGSGHSLFADQFISALQENGKPYLTPREIFLRIAPVIANNSSQTPVTKPILHAGDRGGEFVFILSAAPFQPVPQPAPSIPAVQPVPPPVVPTPNPAAEVETAMWEMVRETKDPAELDLFIETYPNSRYRSQAHSRRWLLSAGSTESIRDYLKRYPKSPFGQVAHKKLWEGVAAENSIQAYEQYIQEFPQSPYAGLAKLKISKLIKERRFKGMVSIPAGEFSMGSEEGGSDERPVHSVYLDEYWIDIYETTVADYRKCVEAGKCDQPKTGGYYNWGKTGRDRHPINGVDWFNAKKYCEYAGKRLPTEAEWERAASWKNGTKYKYPSGKSSVSCADAVMDDRNKYGGSDSDGCGKDRTWPVGSKPAEINGTYDLAGNVWEWVLDWYDSDYYSRSPRNNPQGPDSGSGRVSRGGGWGSTASYLRGADRNNDVDPSGRDNDLGFRCAVSP